MFKEYIKLGVGFYIGWSMIKIVDNALGLTKKAEKYNVNIFTKK